MPSSYSTNLGIELPEDGELDGLWGDVVNTNMGILDRAINGSVSLTLSGTSSTLTTSDGVLSNGQYKLLTLAGSPSGTHTITIAPNDAQKIYFVRNTTAQSVVFTQGSGGNVTVAAGDSGIIYSNGAGATAAVALVVPPVTLATLGVTATTAELNYVDGVTSSIQTQLDNRVTSNADDTLAAGYTTTAVDDGTKSSGTYTPSPAGGNMRRIVNNGAFTLAAPTTAGDYTMVIQITNGGSPGTITMSGFNRVTGDLFTTTSGDDFFVFITKCNGFVSANVQALQ